MVYNNTKKKQLVKLLVNMIMASNLQGCQDERSDAWTMSWSWICALCTIVILMVMLARSIMLMQYKNEELERYRMVWKTVREAAHLQRDQDPFNNELDPCVYEEDKEEEDDVDGDETLTEMSADEEAPRTTPIPGVDRSEAAIMRRHRVVRHEVRHEAANEGGEREAPEGRGEPEEAEEDESFEEEPESPRARYRRYFQSTMDEVSDPDEWADMHYGVSTRPTTPESGEGEVPGEPSERSRSGHDDVPVPKAMPKALAKSRSRRIAMETAMDIAEAIENSPPPVWPPVDRRGASMNLTEENYFLSSIPMASIFGIPPLPREPIALEDYRWDLLGAGLGPETVIVRNCQNLSRFIPTVTDEVERRSLECLLRNLQGLLIKFQSGDPRLWLETSEQTCSWLSNERSQYHWDEEETEWGSQEDAEEEDREDDPEQGDDDDAADDARGDGDGGDELPGQVADSAAGAAAEADSSSAAAADGGAEASADVSAAEPASGSTTRVVLEVFEVLDGPDYDADGGEVSLEVLKDALQGLPDLSPKEDDPLGLSFAGFLEPDCVLECVSFRACAISRFELGPMSAALSKRPWQLRALNLWENRICDAGVEFLATALDEYRGLEFLGLGRNRITDHGLQTLCRPYRPVQLEEAEVSAARDRIAKQEAAIKAAAAKEKTQAQAQTEEGRQRRNSVPLLDELEERSGEEGPIFSLRKMSELRCLVLSENPIKSADVLEAVQPFGPRGADLLLHCTEAATALGLRRPELLKEKERKPLLNLGHAKDASAPPEGWVLRLNPFETHTTTLCPRSFESFELPEMGHFDRLKKYNGKEKDSKDSKDSRDKEKDARLKKTDKELEDCDGLWLCSVKGSNLSNLTWSLCYQLPSFLSTMIQEERKKKEEEELEKECEKWCSIVCKVLIMVPILVTYVLMPARELVLRPEMAIDTPNLSGMRAVVTGGCSGLGLHTALLMAQSGASVTLGCRSNSEFALQRLKKVSKAKAQPAVWPLEMDSFNSVRSFAERYIESIGTLHILVNNVGSTKACSLTTDGIESAFQVNYLSHFLLTNLLLPTLRASSPARIVNVACQEGYLRAARGWSHRFPEGILQGWLGSPVPIQETIRVGSVRLAFNAERKSSATHELEASEILEESSPEVEWNLDRCKATEAYSNAKLAVIAFSRALESRLRTGRSLKTTREKQRRKN
eukprot:s2422_g8.t1